METESDRASPDNNRTLTVSCRVSGAVLIVVGLIVMAGWALRLEPLKSLGQPIAMNPATAIAFALCGLSLLFLCGPLISRRQRLIGQACDGFITAAALLRLSGYLCGWEPCFDRVVFANRLAGKGMAPNTALSFPLLSLSLIILNVRTRRGK